jgi:hypothetical protein
MKSALAGFGSGALFGLGLIVAGMTKPEKVIGFLDFTGSWDPSLMFVMGGAVMVHFVLFRVVRRLPTPVFDTKFHIPTRRDLDARLLIGAALFGIGWGLGGFCPGPGLVSLASGSLAPLVFVLAMTAGMLVQRTWDSIRLRKTVGATEPAPTLTVERPS